MAEPTLTEPGEPPIDAGMETESRLAVEFGDLLRDSSPAAHQFLFDRFGISAEDRAAFIRQAFSRWREARKIEPASSDTPATIHRLWLTNPSAPAPPRDYYLQRMARQIDRLQDGYRTIFWINCPETAASVQDILPGGVEFRDISTLTSEPSVLWRIYEAIDARKFVLAGDMAKFLIMREHGGIYGDMGIDFDRALADVARTGCVALFLDRNLFFQPAFMSAAPNHPLFKMWCRFLSNPELISAVLLDDQQAPTASHEIWIHGGLAFTAALILFHDGAYEVLPLAPNRGLLHCESESSWYSPGNKFGNVTIDQASATQLLWYKHATYAEAFRDLLIGVNYEDRASAIKAELIRNLEAAV